MRVDEACSRLGLVPSPFAGHTRPCWQVTKPQCRQVFVFRYGWDLPFLVAFCLICPSKQGYLCLMS